MHQQPLYLEHADADDLDRLAAELKRSKQALLREAVGDLFIKYRAQGYLRPQATHNIDSEEFKREIAREIRASASVDVDALVKSGDLTPKSRGWYAVRDMAALNRVNLIVRELKEHTASGKSEIWVKLESVKRYQALAKKLRPDV